MRTKSPWAKKVMGELPGAGPSLGAGADAGSGAAPGGRQGRTSNAAAMGDGGLVGGETGGRGGGDAPGGRGGGGARGVIAPEVTVRWDSAKPVLAAMKVQLPAALDGHYAITVLGLPPQMEMMGVRMNTLPPGDSAALQKAVVDSLLKGATLSGKGHDPLNAVMVLQSGDLHALIFGFPKQGFPIAATDKEVTFQLKLGQLTIKAKFQPKEMIYDGQLAV